MSSRVDRALVGLLALCSVLSAGCRKVATVIAGDAGGATVANAPRPSAADDVLGTKLDLYVDCLNNVDARALDSRERYLSWVDRAKGPTGKERIVYGLYEIPLADRCADELKQAQAATPKVDDLDSAGSAYAAALAKLTPIVKTANDYYEHKDYKDDKFAKGKQMHPQLLSAFDGFEKAAKDLHDVWQKHHDDNAQRLLSEIERVEGRKMRWQTRNVSRVAEAMATAVTSRTATVEQKQAAIDAFLKSEADLREFAAKPEARDDKSDLDSFDSYVNALLTPAKDVARALRDKKKIPFRGEGSVEEFLTAYNSFVSSTNLFFRTHA